MIYPAAIILMAVVWACGAMGFLGIPVTVVGTAMPVLLVAIVSAYGIHQMNHYLLDVRTSKLEILDTNMRNVGLAITLSGLTVMVGFGSLVSSAFVPIKNFGVFTALGDLVGVVAALYVLPALILSSRKQKTIFTKEDGGDPSEAKGWVNRILASFVRVNRKASPAVVVISIILAAGSFYGFFLVKTELNNVALFKHQEPVRISDDVLNEKLAGTQVLNVVLDSDLSDPLGRTGDSPAEVVDIATPAVLNKVESFTGDVQKKFPFVHKVLSFNTVLKKMNLEMNGGSPEAYSIPQDKDLISQYLLIFTGDLKSVLSPNHDKLRISLNMKRGSSDDVENVRQYCISYFGEDFLKANHLQVRITGASHLYYVANTLLVEGTIRSIFICLVVVFVLLLLVLRDFWMSLIALVPIFITLLINFGILGYFKIPLNAGTAMVSTVAIGIGVDYSIHFITWFRNELRKDGNITLALERSIMHKGRAILYNMFVIVGGFLVMVISRFIPLIQFGLLTAICMVTTAIGAPHRGSRPSSSFWPGVTMPSSIWGRGRRARRLPEPGPPRGGDLGFPGGQAVHAHLFIKIRLGQRKPPIDPGFPLRGICASPRPEAILSRRESIWKGHALGGTMKRTPELRALCTPSLKANEIYIHPNEGFDLGMMTTAYDVEAGRQRPDPGQAPQTSAPRRASSSRPGSSRSWESQSGPFSVTMG